MRERFGDKVAKISLDAGLTCPNRDGTLSRSGCLFCDALGAGSGASGRGLSIAEQMAEGMSRSGRRAPLFIAYFQSFTNTYAPVGRLEAMWREALRPPQVVALSVGTRPDCVNEEVLGLLADLGREKEVWLELGLQSANDQTLARVNRGHTAADFARAAKAAQEKGLKVLAHVIIGLPGESEADVAATADFLADLNVDGVKIHNLYVSRDAGLAGWWRRGDFRCQTMEEFVDQAASFLRRLPPETVIHRLTGDPNPQTHLAPDWCLNKQAVITRIQQRLAQWDARQGDAYFCGCE